MKKIITISLFCAILIQGSLKTCAEEINAEKVNFELGISCLQQKNYTQAVKYFEMVVKHNPKNLEACYNLALAYKNAGMSEKSVSEFDKVVKLLNDPKYLQQKNINIDQIRNENRVLHDNELATENYGMYSKVKSQENDYIELGDMHYDGQQYETAVEYYNLALQINPYSDSVYFKIAQSYIGSGDYVQAEPYITKAVQLSPENKKYTYYKDLVTKNIGTKYTKNIDLRDKIVNRNINKKDPMQGFDLPEEYKKELFSDTLHSSCNRPGLASSST